MAKKKDTRPADDAGRPKPLTVADIAGLIGMQTRPRMANPLADGHKALAAAQRVLRVFKTLPHGLPHLSKIEEELKNGPFDAHTIVGLIEVCKRSDRAWWRRNDEHLKEVKGRLNAYRKHGLSPQQDAKKIAKECWDEWQKRKAAGSDPYPRGKASFARDVLAKLGDDEQATQRTIEKWCREWEGKT